MCFPTVASEASAASLPQLMMPQLSDNKSSRDLGVSHFDEVLLQFTSKVCSKVEEKLALLLVTHRQTDSQTGKLAGRQG